MTLKTNKLSHKEKKETEFPCGQRFLTQTVSGDPNSTRQMAEKIDIFIFFLQFIGGGPSPHPQLFLLPSLSFSYLLFHSLIQQKLETLFLGIVNKETAPLSICTTVSVQEKTHKCTSTFLRSKCVVTIKALIIFFCPHPTLNSLVHPADRKSVV